VQDNLTLCVPTRRAFLRVPDQLNAAIEGVGDEDDLERWSSSTRPPRRPFRLHGNTSLTKATVMRISTNTEGGATHPITGRSGSRSRRSYRIGRRIVTVTGLTLRLGAIPGWMMNPGALRRSTTVAGSRSAVSWGWVPCRPGAVGVAYVRPVYAPALVAWVGGAYMWRSVIAVGGGSSVGWFPLGPREVYVPSYRASRGYVNNVNVTNTNCEHDGGQQLLQHGGGKQDERQ